MSNGKTPRDWLLGRHSAANPQLDALRRAALSTRSTHEASVSSFGSLWRELFHPHRIVWRGIAVAWLVLLLFHVTLGRVPAPAPSSLATPPSDLARWLAQLDSHGTLAQMDLRR